MARIIGTRLKQFRSARGLSIDELVAKSGGIVSKQSISKYEQGITTPSPRVLTRLAQSLGIKSVDLFHEPAITVRFIAYRKSSTLPKKEQNRIESLVSESLEKHVKLQQLTNNVKASTIPIQSLKVRHIEETETAANDLRNRWHLGSDPIASVIDALEDNKVYVIEVKANGKFDGISAVACRDKDEMPTAAAVIVRSGLVGERQRLDLTHELGHVVLDIDKSVDEEKAAFRFGAAFLAPKELILREVGEKRSSIRFDELIMLKKRFGMSIQSILFRLKDLDIISKNYYTEWCKTFSKAGYRKAEPCQLPPEKSVWLRQSVLRSYSEGAISHADAENLLNEKLENGDSLKSVQLKSFMKLPLAERNRILNEQANATVAYYEKNSQWKDLGAGDFVSH